MRLRRSQNLLLALSSIAAAALAFAGYQGWLKAASLPFSFLPAAKSGDRGIAWAMLAIPAFSVAWTFFLLIRPLRELARREPREQLALTRLPAWRWLARRLSGPLGWLLLPSVIALPILGAALHDYRSVISFPVYRFANGGKTFGAMTLRIERDPKVLDQSRKGGETVYLHRIYPLPAALGIPALLAISTLAIAAAGIFRSLERLCRSHALPMAAYAGIWIALAAILPFIVYCGANRQPTDAPIPIHPEIVFGPQVSVGLPAWIAFPLGADSRAWTGSILFAVLALAYALFCWKRLCAAYYRFE